MVVVDFTTKQAHMLPVHTTLSAEGTAEVFYRDIWKHHGLPEEVVSD